MIWIALSIILSTVIICCTIITCNWCYKDYNNAMSCLIDLVHTLNEKFPNSSLRVSKNSNEVKVEGELKYYIKNGD